MAESGSTVTTATEERGTTPSVAGAKEAVSATSGAPDGAPKAAVTTAAAAAATAKLFSERGRGKQPLLLGP